MSTVSLVVRCKTGSLSAWVRSFLATTFKSRRWRQLRQYSNPTAWVLNYRNNGVRISRVRSGFFKWAGKKEIWFEPEIWSELLRRLGSLGQISSHNKISEPIEKLDFFGHLTDFSWGKKSREMSLKIENFAKKIYRHMI